MKIAVVGASGHTGRFVLEELARRGLTPVAVVRDASRLRADVETRIASIDDAPSLDRGLAGAHAVINCAGPFLDTAAPVIEAALRAGIHYLDVTAEQTSAQNSLTRYDAEARERGVAIVPAAGFYGALADLLATAALGDWTSGEIRTAVGLDRWWPTEGTRRTGARNTYARLALRDGRLQAIDTPESAAWVFSQPLGTQPVTELPFSETILMARHLPVREIRHFINEAPLLDLRDATTPPPTATDERGRSSQRFIMDVVATNGARARSVVAEGTDIYAITAPIVVEAAERILRDCLRRGGAFAPGELFEAVPFLESLTAHGVQISARDYVEQG